MGYCIHLILFSDKEDLKERTRLNIHAEGTVISRTEGFRLSDSQSVLRIYTPVVHSHIRKSAIALDLNKVDGQTIRKKNSLFFPYSMTESLILRK